MATSEIERKLRRLRRRLRELIVLSGLSRLVVVAVGALAVALVLDRAARFEAPGRLLLLLGTAGASAYALYRFLVLPLGVRLRPERLALLVERHHPELRDRLISTIELSRLPDPAPLSRAMVERLVAETDQVTRALDFQDVASGRRAAAWVAAAFATSLLAVAYTYIFPASAAVFAYRLFAPFSPVQWPQRTQLTLLAYDKDGHQLAVEGERILVPKGEDLNVVVRAARFSGRVWHPPRRVVLHYQYDKGGSGRRTVAMAEEATYRTCFPTVTEGFRLYATGDDATTRPFHVEVRDRPRIEDIRIVVRAPAYTGEPERIQADGRGTIAGLEGSRVTIEVRTSKPILATPGSARLAINDQPPIPMTFISADRYAAERKRLEAQGKPVPRYQHDPFRLHASFVLKPGQKQYAIELVDTDGLTNSPAPTYRIEVRPDRKPVVRLTKPGRSKKVTAKAIVPIALEAKDDFAVARARFVFARGEKAKPAAHDFPPPAKPTKEFEATLDWDLTPLALREGETIFIHAEAEDNFPGNPDAGKPGPNVGKSRTYLLTVVSEAEMASILLRQQQQLKEQLKNLITRQEDLKATTESHNRQPKPDRRKLAIAEREQQKTAAAARKLAADLRDTRTEMENNKVATPVELRRLEALARAVDNAAQNQMPSAARHIARAAQSTKPKDQHQHLDQAIATQNQAIADLRAALANFEQWRDIDELIADANKLLLTQKKLKSQTTDLARKLLGKTPETLSPEEKGQATSLARAQRAARDSMAALETKIAQTAQKLAKKDPAAAKLLEQALAQTTADQIRKHMDDAATDIGRARPTSALPPQQQAIAGLQKLLEALNRARNPLLARDLQRLQERLDANIQALKKLLERQRRLLSQSRLADIRRQLRRLRQRQAATAQATAKANTPNDLASQANNQQGIATKTEQLARTLERLEPLSPEDKKTAQDARKAIADASARMKQAAQALQAAKKPDAAAAQDKALERLDQADQALATLQRRLAKAESQAQRLAAQAKEQNSTAAETTKTAKAIERTARETQKLLPSTARRLQQATDHTSQAASQMKQAARNLEAAARNQQPAQNQQQAQQKQQEATNRLQEALDQMARARQQLDLRRRAQKLFELRKALGEILPRQVAIRKTTEQLDQETRGATRPLNHAQTIRLREIADEQAALRQQADVIIQHLQRERVPVFLYVMNEAARLMDEVHQRLRTAKVDWLTQDAEREIEAHITQLLEALKSEARRLAQAQQRPPSGGGGGGGGRRPLVAPQHQLKQLKALQLQVNQATRAIELERATGTRLSKRLLENRARRLARRQRDLAELSRKFAQLLEKGREQETMGAP